MASKTTPQTSWQKALPVVPAGSPPPELPAMSSAHRSPTAMEPNATYTTLAPRAAAALNSATGKSPLTVLTLAPAALQGPVMCGALSLAVQPTAVQGKRSRTSSAHATEPGSGSGATSTSEVVMRFSSAENHWSRESNSLSKSTPKRSVSCCARGRRSLAQRASFSSSSSIPFRQPMPGYVTSEMAGMPSTLATSSPCGVMGSYATSLTFNSRQRASTCSPASSVLARGQMEYRSSAATHSLKSPHCSSENSSRLSAT
mmetsp:Transcript_79107/g.232260  ORF Transcript_79107/g.232260 Transcript_79107/m.232260 type:complete len:258 (-) Transcript_79107:310-1083(-)